jgi:hypothetical protein
MARFLKVALAFLTAFSMLNAVFFLFVESKQPWAVQKMNIKTAKWNDIKNLQNEYDALFLGSSRGFLAYSPKIFDGYSGMSSYNLCSGSQNIVESYYILQETLKYRTPRTIYYEMFLPSFSKNTDYLNVVTTAKCFDSSSGAFEMIVLGFGVEGIVNWLFPVIRDRVFIKSSVLRFLFTSNQAKPLVPLVINKGHNQVSKTVTEDQIQDFTPIYTFSNTQVSDQMIEDWFDKFVELCSKNDIELVCVRAPYPPTRMLISATDPASVFFSKKCAVHNLQFIDFNHLENDTVLYLDRDFYDYHHMNLSGSKKVSKHLAFRIRN